GGGADRPAAEVVFVEENGGGGTAEGGVAVADADHDQVVAGEQDHALLELLKPGSDAAALPFAKPVQVGMGGVAQACKETPTHNNVSADKIAAVEGVQVDPR